jgi:hypothetical protein
MILFLDFDGVLHPNDRTSDTFCRLPLLASWLREWPGVDVVISSSWRTAFRQSELVDVLGPVVGQRVVGCTPDLPRSTLRRFCLAEREQEIRMWMQISWQPDRPWVALDDWALKFFPESPGLVLCNDMEGITLPILDRLTVHAQRAGLTHMPASAGGEVAR